MQSRFAQDGSHNRKQVNDQSRSERIVKTSGKWRKQQLWKNNKTTQNNGMQPVKSKTLGDERRRLLEDMSLHKHQQ